MATVWRQALRQQDDIETPISRARRMRTVNEWRRKRRHCQIPQESPSGQLPPQPATHAFRGACRVSYQAFAAEGRDKGQETMYRTCSPSARKIDCQHQFAVMISKILVAQCLTEEIKTVHSARCPVQGGLRRPSVHFPEDGETSIFLQETGLRPGKLCKWPTSGRPRQGEDQEGE